MRLRVQSITYQFALTSVLVLSSCSEHTQGPIVSQINSNETTDVSVGECIFLPGERVKGKEEEKEEEKLVGESLLAVIGAALLTAVVQESVSLVANSVKAAGEGKTASSVPASSNFLLKANETPKCVQIVRGRFFRQGAPVANPYWLREAKISDETFSRLTAEAYIIPSERPNFIIEARLVRAPASNIFVLRPHYTAFFKPIEHPRLSGDRSRLMSIAIEFRREGSAKDPIPVSLNLERQYVGEVRCLPPLQLLPSPDKPGTQECSTGRPETSKPNEASPSTSGTIPGVGRGGGTNSIQAEPTSKGPLREEWTQRQPYESSWFSFPSSGIASRYTVQTVITEARDANEFAAFWGRVLDASKKDVAAAISTEAGKALIPEQREAAEATRKTAQESARSSFATQLAMARQKLQACATAELGSIDLAQAALEASNEVLKANRLARAAGKPKPFSDPEIPEKASDKTRDACIRILQSSI